MKFISLNKRPYCDRSEDRGGASPDSMMGFRYDEIGEAGNGDTNPAGEGQDAAPAELVGEIAADGGRDHGTRCIGHQQIGEHFNNPVRAIDIARDGAGQRHVAGAAGGLQEAPGDQCPD